MSKTQIEEIIFQVLLDKKEFVIKDSTDIFLDEHFLISAYTKEEIMEEIMKKVSLLLDRYLLKVSSDSQGEAN